MNLFSDDGRRNPYPLYDQVRAESPLFQELADLLTRLDKIQLASNEPWEPRRGLHVHGPSRLLIQFTAAGES